MHDLSAYASKAEQALPQKLPAPPLILQMLLLLLPVLRFSMPQSTPHCCCVRQLLCATNQTGRKATGDIPQHLSCAVDCAVEALQLCCLCVACLQVLWAQDVAWEAHVNGVDEHWGCLSAVLQQTAKQSRHI
jgi:hypothetical protein